MLPDETTESGDAGSGQYERFFNEGRRHGRRTLEVGEAGEGEAGREHMLGVSEIHLEWI